MKRRLKALWHRTPRWLLVLGVLLLGIRAALPWGIEAFVNRKLDGKSGYTGSIGHVDLHLLAGGYVIHDVEIFKQGDNPIPFMAARRINLSIQWSELIHGSLVGEVFFDRGRLNFIAGSSPEKNQTEVDREWVTILEELFPFQLNRFTLSQGEIHFQNPESDPPIDLSATHVELVATNFTNARKSTESLSAGIEATAKILEGGSLDVMVSLDPFARHPTFDLDLAIENVDLRQLNEFLRAYGKFDVQKGKFSLGLEVAGHEGNFKGYLKPVFDDLDILNFGEERKKKKLTQVFWETLLSGTAELLENQPNDRLAAKIPISGKFSDVDVHVLPSIASLLKNAFIRALLPGVDGTIDLHASR